MARIEDHRRPVAGNGLRRDGTWLIPGITRSPVAGRCSCPMWLHSPRKWMLLLGSWLLCAAWLSPCLATGSSRSGKTASTSQQQAFRSAMLRGNAKAALRILREGGEGALTTEIYRDQLEYRLPQMLTASRKCRDEAFRDGNGETALYCDGFVYHSASLTGNAQETFAALAWSRSHGGAIWAKTHPLEKVPLKFPGVDVAKLAQSIPPFSAVVTSSAPVTLPYVVAAAPPVDSSKKGAFAGETAHPGLRLRPFVHVLVNGHRVQAQVDTGTDDAFVVTATEAKALGLQPLVTHLPHSINRLGRPPAPAGADGWSLVAKLELGPLHARNVLAVVVPDRDNAGLPSLVIGLPLLARFDRVDFNRSGMVVNAPAATCRDSLPITYAANGSLGGVLVFPAKADGKPINAMLDTGSNAYLVVGPRLIPSAASKIVAANARMQDWKRRYIRVNITQSLHTAGNALMDGGLPEIADADFGFPQPWLKSVRFDFEDMSICFDPGKPSSSAWDTSSVSMASIPASALSGPTRLAPVVQPRAFQIPLLRGMDLYPGFAVVDRYAPPPPPWLHVRIHCVIDHGNVYIDGKVVGNFGRPVPGVVIYQGRGGEVFGSVTSGQSGKLHGIEPLTGSYLATPPGLRRHPMYCVVPHVKVGTPLHVKQDGKNAKAG